MSSRLAPPTRPGPNAFHVALTRVASIGVLLGASLVVWTYGRALEPHYGSAAAVQHLSKVVWSGAILGSFAPTIAISHATLALAFLLYALPNSSYWAAVYTARLGDPQWGAVATHLIVLLPVLALGTALVKALQDAPHNKDDESKPQSSITLPVCATAINSLQGLWLSVPYVPNLTNDQIFLQLATACITLWAIAPFLPNIRPPLAAPATTAAPKQKRKKDASAQPSPALQQAKTQTFGGLGRLRVAILPVLPFLLAVLRAPTLPQPLLQPYYHPSYPLRILSSVQSTYSGVVVVGESLASNPDEPGSIDHLRFLRAGHSLLGGVWVGPKAQALEPDLQLLDEAGEKIGDSIYSAFLVQEAALLAKKLRPESALIIGLGTGIAATSFMRHGISTTLVEIDPAVYDAARRFFGLPTPLPDKLFIQDARAWVHSRTIMPKAVGETKGDESEGTALPFEDRFDIVVHDCFSGGGVPAHLYTQEFWQELRQIIKPDAVVAVNFVGSLMSDSATAVILTLRTVFPHCRAFSDTMDPSATKNTEFANWVLFCTPSADPLEFREPVPSDFLGSYLRRHILLNLHEHEGDISAIGRDLPAEKRERFILKDAQNPLAGWQSKEAMGHWKIMRSVLPDVFWETY